METSQSQLNSLKQQHQKLSAEVYNQIQHIHLLQDSLKNALKPFSRPLQQQLSHLPGAPGSYYWQIFQAYWRSFELFGEKFTTVSQQLSLPFETPKICSARPATDTEDDWADIVEELEELRDTLHLQRVQRTSLLLLIELLDSTERLSRLLIPTTNRKGRKFVQSLHRLQGHTKALKRKLEQTLVGYDIHRIAVSLGQYPPPETTRIIARRDNNTDDDVMIVEIATMGYTWQTGLLRKADVIVESSRRNIN